VLDSAGIAVTALGIPHGGMPTLAYRVQTRNVSIVFSSDQTGTDPHFTALAKGANVLIMHMTIDAGASSPLHASPSEVVRDRPECRSGPVDSGGRGIGGFNCEVAIKWSAGADPLLSLILGTINRIPKEEH